MRRHWPSIAVVTAAGLVAGCTASNENAEPPVPPTTTAVDAPVRGGKVVVALDQEPASLNPAITTDSTVHAAADSLFNGLVALDVGGNPLPALAESWTIEEEGRSYRFQLRENVKWHDGRAFTSSDVKFTFERALLVHHERARRTIGAAGVKIETPDSGTVLFTFASPYVALLRQLDVSEAPILPEHVYESCNDISSPDGCPANRSPIGTGPFKLASHDAGEIRMVRNPEYFRTGQPYLDQLVFRVIPDPAVRVSALQTHDVDWVWNTPENALPTLREDRGVVVAELARGPGGGNCVATMAFNLQPDLGRVPYFADVRVRHALWAATDRPGAIPELGSGAAQMAIQPIHSRAPVAKTTRLNLPVFDTDRARLLLERAGWQSGGGGARVARGVPGVADGTPFTLEVRAVGSRQARYAQTLKEQWREVGVEVRAIQEFGAISDLPASDQQFDLAFASYCAESDPTVGTRPQFVSDATGGPGPGNLAGYSNPRMDELWAQAGTELDLARRQQIFQEIQELAVEDLPYMWLAETSYLLTWNAVCSGWNFGSAGLFAETVTCKR